ncbi:hypothetical protein IW140_005414 [Coemansia sp. RSA 1813]|nr:hypothetical protein EV178_005372 [Coemansia sp. RSA 1646]KAJ2211591.1 hypothetical protein EV179_005357 [Coemansia sp. RSA 487]KAJ2565203.1 hypothetical protein IW140_005414 [Coemansia sp. RSA 1813]
MKFYLLPPFISVLLLAPTASSSPTAIDSKPNDNEASDWRQQMLAHLNAIRKAAGAPPMLLDSRANIMADAHSWFQASINLMTHDDPGGSVGERASVLGIQWLGLAENVAAGDDLGLVEVMELWKNSPHHYANMIGDYSLAGFGVAKSNVSRTVYWTQEFIRPWSTI